MLKDRHFVELSMPPVCLEGWHNLINSTLDEIQTVVDTKQYYEHFKIREIKEKFGALRIYCNYPYDIRIDGIIKRAIEDSIHICEVCGKKGTLKNYKTRCPRCRRKGL